MMIKANRVAGMLGAILVSGLGYAATLAEAPSGELGPTRDVYWRASSCPSATWEVMVDPLTRTGAEGAVYTASRDGEVQWTKELPFFLRDLAVGEDGSVVGLVDGVDSVEGKAGESKRYVDVVFIDPEGEVLRSRRQLLGRQECEGQTMFFSGAHLAGPVDSGQVVLRLQLRRGVMAGFVEEEWTAFSIAGRELNAFSPTLPLRVSSVGSELNAVLGIPGTPFLLAEWLVFESTTHGKLELGQCLGLIDPRGDGNCAWHIYRKDGPNDSAAARGLSLSQWLRQIRDDLAYNNYNPDRFASRWLGFGLEEGEIHQYRWFGLTQDQASGRVVDSVGGRWCLNDLGLESSNVGDDSGRVSIPDPTELTAIPLSGDTRRIFGGLDEGTERRIVGFGLESGSRPRLLLAVEGAGYLQGGYTDDELRFRPTGHVTVPHLSDETARIRAHLLSTGEWLMRVSTKLPVPKARLMIGREGDLEAREIMAYEGQGPAGIASRPEGGFLLLFDSEEVPTISAYDNGCTWQWGSSDGACELFGEDCACAENLAARPGGGAITLRPLPEMHLHVLGSDGLHVRAVPLRIPGSSRPLQPYTLACGPQVEVLLAVAYPKEGGIWQLESIEPGSWESDGWAHFKAFAPGIKQAMWLGGELDGRLFVASERGLSCLLDGKTWMKAPDLQRNRSFTALSQIGAIATDATGRVAIQDRVKGSVHLFSSDMSPIHYYPLPADVPPSVQSAELVLGHDAVVLTGGRHAEDPAYLRIDLPSGRSEELSRIEGLQALSASGERWRISGRSEVVRIEANGSEGRRLRRRPDRFWLNPRDVVSDSAGECIVLDKGVAGRDRRVVPALCFYSAAGNPTRLVPLPRLGRSPRLSCNDEYVMVSRLDENPLLIRREDGHVYSISFSGSEGGNWRTQKVVLCPAENTVWLFRLADGTASLWRIP